MITYDRFWKTLEDSPETYYTLTRKHGISNGTMTKLKHNQSLTTNTLDKLCQILKCKIEDICEYVASYD